MAFVGFSEKYSEYFISGVEKKSEILEKWLNLQNSTWVKIAYLIATEPAQLQFPAFQLQLGGLGQKSIHLWTPKGLLDPRDFLA